MPIQKRVHSSPFTAHRIFDQNKKHSTLTPLPYFLNPKRGQIFILTLVFLAVVGILAGSLFTKTAFFLRFTDRNKLQDQATYVAEAGIDYALWQLNQTAGAYTGNETKQLGNSEFVIGDIPNNLSLRTITSTAYTPSAANPKAVVKVTNDAKIDGSVQEFNYAMLIGDIGVIMNGTINGEVWSNEVIWSTSGTGKIFGNAWATNDIVPLSIVDPAFTAHPNQNTTQPMPTLDYQFWRDKAFNEGGEIDCALQPGGFCTLVTGDIGPKKYKGNVIISSLADINVKGPIYITGNLSSAPLGGADITLDNSFGSSGTVLLVDNIITLGCAAPNSCLPENFSPNNANPKGYLIVASALNSTINNGISIGFPATLAPSNQNAIFYALDSRINVYENANLFLLASRGLQMEAGTLTYQSGIASPIFTSGPGASWQLKRGTYQAKRLDPLPLPPKPIAHWKFNENIGTWAADSSGNNLTGGLTNGPVWTTIGCKYDNCLNFDGANDYVDFGDPALLSLNRDFTLMAWVKPDTASSPRGIISHGLGEWYLRFNNASASNKLHFLESWTANILDSTATIPTGQWTHAAVTVSNGATATVTLYINGSASGATTTTRTLNDGAEKVTVGADRQGTSERFDGLIDDVRIYNKALTPAEITAAMNNVPY